MLSPVSTGSLLFNNGSETTAQATVFSPRNSPVGMTIVRFMLAGRLLAWRTKVRSCLSPSIRWGGLK